MFIAFIESLKEEIKVLKDALDTQNQNNDKLKKNLEFQIKTEQLHKDDIKKTSAKEIEILKRDYTEIIDEKDSGKFICSFNLLLL